MPIIAEVATVVLAHAIGAWLATYLLHSTVLHVLASAIERVRADAALHAVAWRTVLIAPVFTASLHTALPFGSPFRLSTDPAGAVLGPRPVFALLVVVLWYVIVTVRVISLTRAERRERASLGERRRCSDARLLKMLGSQAAAAGMRRAPRLTTSRRIVSPVAIARGEVCIPTGIFEQLGGDEQHALLAHEVAHLARRDPLWSGAAVAVAAVCWFQPLNRRALRRLGRASELAADACAVRMTGEPLALARALAALAPHVVRGPRLRTAATGSPLLERVRCILDVHTTRRPSSRATAVLLAGVLIGVCLAVGPGVNFTIRNAANSIPSLTPSPAEPSREMLEIRRVNRRLLAVERSITRR